MFTFAQRCSADGSAVGAALIMFVFTYTFAYVFLGSVICTVFYVPLSVLPREHQRMQPGMVFLLLIPIFNLIWAFVVVIQVTGSLKDYFTSTGRTDAGTCGRTLGLWSLMLGAAGAVVEECPMRVAGHLGAVLSLAGVVLFIVFIVKVWSLKNQIATGGTASELHHA